MYGQSCWQGCEDDQGGLREIVKGSIANRRLLGRAATTKGRWPLPTEIGERREMEGRRNWTKLSGPCWHRIRCTYTTTSSCGVHGIIILCTLRNKRTTVNGISFLQKRRRDGQDGGRLMTRQQLSTKNSDDTNGRGSKKKTWKRLKDVLRKQQRRLLLPQSLTDRRK